MEIEIWIIWLFAAILLFAVEVFFTSFVTVFIGISALITSIGAILDLNLPLQILLFIGLSLLGVFQIRPLIKRSIYENRASGESNALVGHKTRGSKEYEDILKSELK